MNSYLTREALSNLFAMDRRSLALTLQCVRRRWLQSFVAARTAARTGNYDADMEAIKAAIRS